MDKKLSTSFKKNPYVIGGAVILGVTALIVATVKIVKNIKGGKSRRDADDQLRDETQNALDKLNQHTITEVDAKTLADQLFEAMNGVGTDETAIEDILIKSNATATELIAINKAFGVREYGTFGLPWFGSGEQLNLTQWLKRELSSSSNLYEKLKVKFTTSGLNF